MYGFIAAWSGAMLQALVMAEMASMYVKAIVPVSPAVVQVFPFYKLRTN